MEGEEGFFPAPQQQFVKVDSRDPNFNQWFLDCKEDLENLKNYWRGWARNEKGDWYQPEDKEDRRIMNEKGIHWAGQLMESYLSKPYFFTNWDKEEMNWSLRQTARAVWRGLAYQYSDFGLSKINVYVVGKQMFSQIHAMMLASRGEGLRGYLSKTQTLTEVRNTTPQQQQGFLSNVMGIFNRNRGG